MLESFEISASSGSYPVTVGTNLLSQLLIENPDAIYIVDKILEPRLPPIITKRIVVEAIEANKSLEFAPHVIKELRRLGADRTSHLFAIGGGIIQDVTTFAASIYMRGVPWTYLPTTLLSMVDSCIGGKSSINAAGYKNLVGNFFPPSNVLVDVSFIATLDAEMIVGGLYEAAKICYASGYPGFLAYLAEQPCCPMTPERAQRVILQSLRTKKWFIEVDEFDQKERLLLNFGHTFGHAMEGASHFTISHGIAVGLGIQCALEFERANGIRYGGAPRVQLLEDHLDTMIRSVPGLNVHLRAMSLDDVLNRFESDKKHDPKNYALILVNEKGSVILKKIEKSERTRGVVRTAVQSVMDRYA